jgi:hypothetical protein
MENHLANEGQEYRSIDLEGQHYHIATSNPDLGLLSPSLSQSHANDRDPLISPAAPPFFSSTSLNTRSEGLIRRPVLPRRPSAISSQESPEYVELSSMMSKDPNTLDDKSESIAPKAFRKRHRFLGLNLGYWRQPARHFSIFSVLALFVIIPLYFVATGYNSLQSYAPLPFTHNCYQGSGGWSFVGINVAKLFLYLI